jgi:hypothetical protein
MFFTSDDTGTGKERGMNGNRQRSATAHHSRTIHRNWGICPA